MRSQPLPSAIIPCTSASISSQTNALPNSSHSAATSSISRQHHSSISSEDSTSYPNRNKSVASKSQSCRPNHLLLTKQESLSWTTDDEFEEAEDSEEEQEEDSSNENLNSTVQHRNSRVQTISQVPVEPQVNLPLRTQIRLVVERALALQLQENTSHYPRRPWLRRQIDTLALRLLVFIMHYHRELCIIFLFCVSGLASLRTSPMKTRSTPEPKPFFDNTKAFGYMEDLYRGEYVDLVQTKINLGPAFVFYYAPWDSESVAARDVFLNVAHYFHSTLPHRLRFYAVNCWWPQGECRKNYKNLSHFPIFVAHVERNAGIIYSGPIRAELIIKFLSYILKPLTRIDTEEELWRFRAQHDAIMLSYFNFTKEESVQAYETYRQMALRNFEADPFGQVGYGIFLRQELAEKYFLTSSNVISLVLFNEIHTAKWTGEKDTPGIRGPVGQVANWVIERTRKPPITWAYQIRTGFANRPVALGPVDLSDELSKGPVMLLITRRYFPSSYSPFYAQMKEIALDYFNCNRSGNVTRLRHTAHKINAEWMSLWNSVTRVCAEQRETETLSSDSCLLLKHQLKHWELKKSAFIRESLANYELASERMNFTGLACTSDRQFKFFAIDPIDMPHFVELGFGGLGFHKDSDPVAFLVDAQNEMILPISKFNITELAEIIYKYTIEAEISNEHSRKLFTSHWWSDPSVHSKNTAVELSENDSPSKEYSFVKEIVGSDTPLNPVDQALLGQYQYESHPSKRRSYVLKINSEDLDKYLRGAEPFHLPTPMFLMHTAAFCGSCGVAMASFVELSRFLSDYYHLGINITFAKIDMVQNSLPVGMYPDKIPAFAFLPGNARFDARVFPADEQITSKTLLRFLLTEFDPETRIKLSLQSPGCNPNQLTGQECPSNPEASPNKAKRYHNHRECVSQKNQTSNSTSSARDNCVSVNRLSVTEKLQQIFNEIHNGYYSHPQPDFSGELGINMEMLKTQDLDHLRSMKITLDVY